MVCGTIVASQMNVVSSENGESFDILVCSECGLGQTSPQPDDLNKYYVGYHGGRHGFTARFRAWKRTGTLNHCFDDVMGKSVLDVGCGNGDFLLEAERCGWKVVGTELDEPRSEIDSINVLPDLAAVEAEFGEAAFEAITCWHTLEHFYEPATILADVAKLLRSDGVLLIAVPNFGGLQSRIFGESWLHLDVPRHLWHFTSEALERLLRQHGFSVRLRRHSEFEYDVLGWSQGWLNTIFRTPNVFFKLLSGKAANVPLVSKLLHFVVGSLFSVACIPLVIIGSLAGKGGTLVVEAVKSNNGTPIFAK